MDIVQLYKGLIIYYQKLIHISSIFLAILSQLFFKNIQIVHVRFTSKLLSFYLITDTYYVQKYT